VNTGEMVSGHGRLLGEVEASGEIYWVVERTAQVHEVVRRADRQRVGKFCGSPALMWRLEPETIDVDRLRGIVRAAIVDGLIADLPTD